MRFVLPAPAPRDGLPFALSDLQAAMAWAAAHPSVRLRVATNYLKAPEIIQIYSSDAVLPRWVLWRDHTGRLHVEDRGAPEINLHLPLIAALRLIEASLK
jgi:hypothetical protein